MMTPIDTTTHGQQRQKERDVSTRPNIRTLQMQDTIDRQKRRIFLLEQALYQAIAYCDRLIDEGRAGDDCTVVRAALRAAMGRTLDLSTLEEK